MAGPIENGPIRFIEDNGPDYLTAVQATLSDEKAAQLSAYAAQMPPGSSPDAILAAFQSGAAPDTDATDATVAAVDGSIAAKPQATVASDSDTEHAGLSALDMLQGVTRTAMSVLSLPVEAIKGTVEYGIGQATGRNMVGGDTATWNDVLEGTSLWQQVGHWNDQGSNWFLGGGAAEAQEQRRADLLYSTKTVWVDKQTGSTYDNEADIPARSRDRYHAVTTVNPSSAGQEAAGALFAENTAPYKWATAITDLVAFAALDPLTYASGGSSVLVKGASKVGVEVTTKASKAAEFASAQAKAAGAATNAEKAGMIREVLDLSDEARKAESEALSARLQAIDSLDKSQRTAAMDNEAKNLTDRLLVHRLAQASSEQAARDAGITGQFEQHLADIAREAGEKQLSHHEQVAALEEAVKQATDARLKALEEQSKQGIDAVTDLQTRHREAASLFKDVQDGSPVALGDDIADTLEDLRSALAPKPGPASRKAENIINNTTSTEAQVAKARRAAEKASQVEAARAARATDSVDRAEKAFSLLERRAELARRADDAETLVRIEAAKAQLLSQAKMLRWPADTVKASQDRVFALNRLTAGVTKTWAKDTERLAKTQADELAAQLSKAEGAVADTGRQIDTIGQAEEAALRRYADAQAEGIHSDLMAGVDNADDMLSEGLSSSANLRESDAALAIGETAKLFADLRAKLDGVRAAHEADALAAGRAATKAEQDAAKAMARMQEKMDILRASHGLTDQITRLMYGETGPLREAMQEAAGLSQLGAADFSKFQQVLFGKTGQIALSMLASETSPTKIWRAMGRKLDMEFCVQLSKATTEDEVMQVMAQALGTRSGIAGKINGFGFRTYTASVPKDTSAWAKMVAGTNEKAFNAYSASQRVVPWAHELHIEDVQSVTLALDDWLNMALGPKARLALGRGEARNLITEMVDKVAVAPDMFARRKAVAEVMSTVTGRMATAYGIPQDSLFVTKLMEKMNEGFRTVDKSVAAGTNFLPVSGMLNPANLAADIKGVNALDEKVPWMASQLSEFFRLPDIKEVQQIIRDGKKVGETSGLRDHLDHFLTYRVDRLFRTAVLVFRPAYVIRNVGEAAFRMFLNGSMQDPMTMAAMAIRHSKDRRFLSHFNAYSHDIMGNSFRSYADPAMDSISQEMRGSMYRAQSVMDPGFQRRLVSNHQGVILPPGAKGHRKAWGHVLDTIRGDQVTADVVSVAMGQPTKRISTWAKSVGLEGDMRNAVVRYYAEGPGKAVFERLASERPSHWGQMLDAAGRTDKDQIIAALASGRWRIDETALEQILFSHEASFYNRARAYLKDFDPELTAAWLGRDAKAMSKRVDALGSGAQTGLPSVWTSGSLSDTAAAENLWQRGVDQFFHYSAVAEGAANWAPETRIAYWKKIEDLFPHLSKADQETVLAHARKSLSPIKIGGKNWGLRKADRMAKRFEEMASDAERVGNLTWKDAHALAAQDAVAHTKKLFYDGFQKKQYWYSARLLFPFGQAWGNTLYTWGRLAAQPPGMIRVIALKKAYDAFGDGYENTSDAEWEAKKRQYLSDPSSRPLLYRDPVTNQMVFDVPIVGKIAGMFGAPAETPMSLSSLNVSTNSGQVLPGFGPVITIPAKTLYNFTNVENYTPAWVDKWIEPFPSGMEDGAARLVYESFTGAWMRRVAAAIDPSWGDQEIQAMTPQLTTYLATAHPDRYLNEAGVFTEEGKQLMSDDVVRIARQMSLYRGLSQAVLPGTALFRWMIETGDGTDVTQAAAYQDFQAMMEANGQEFGDAAKDFENAYGKGSLLAILGKYKGDFSPTTKAADYFQNNADDLTKYPNVAGLFFPYDGTYSASFDADLRTRDLKVALTPEEMMTKANQSRYYTIKATLQEKVDSGQITADQADTEMKRLSDEFGVAYNPALRKDRDAQIREIRDALTGDSNLKNTDAGQAAAKYMELRNIGLAKLEASGVAKSFGDKDAAAIAKYLYEKGSALAQQYPDFARMWTNVFEGEVS